MNIKNPASIYSAALQNIRPNANWVFEGSEISWTDELDESGNPTGKIISNLRWYDTTQSEPSRQEIEDEYNRLVNLWDSTEYQRLRQPEYPPLADLADALYWQAQGDDSKMTAYLAAVDAVKQKYPKGV